MGPFGKSGSRTKIDSRDTSAEDERSHGYNAPVPPIDIERVEAPVTVKVTQDQHSGLRIERLTTFRRAISCAHSPALRDSYSAMTGMSCALRLQRWRGH